MSLTEAAKEATYLRRFLDILGFERLRQVTIFCDNNSALRFVENPIFHNRSKHMFVITTSARCWRTDTWKLSISRPVTWRRTSSQKVCQEQSNVDVWNLWESQILRDPKLIAHSSRRSVGASTDWCEPRSTDGARHSCECALKQ